MRKVWPISFIAAVLKCDFEEKMGNFPSQMGYFGNLVWPILGPCRQISAPGQPGWSLKAS
jgi:hypothetical protein